MELIRDLVRDLVGIIFPGSLLIILTFGLFFGISIIFSPSALLNVVTFANNSVGFLILLVFSYVAGQYLRLKRLTDLETVCTKEYQKSKKGVADSVYDFYLLAITKLLTDRYFRLFFYFHTLIQQCRKKNLSDANFNESINKIKIQEQKYYDNPTEEYEKLKELYKEHYKKFVFWEKFPYQYHMKRRRLFIKSENYNKFFEKKTNIRFFGFCKTVIYEYSPSLKEEIIRQESLIRLFAGIYYVTKYGLIMSAIVSILHLSIIIKLCFLKVRFFSYSNLEYSVVITIISVFIFRILFYLRREIIDRLRYMRSKEVELVYDSFYIICKRKDFKMDNNED